MLLLNILFLNVDRHINRYHRQKAKKSTFLLRYFSKKVPGGASRRGGDLVSREREPRASSTTSEYDCGSNQITTEERTPTGEPSESKQTEQCHLRPVPELAGLQFTGETQ